MIKNYKYCPYCKGELVINKNWDNCPKCKKTIYKHSSITASIFPIRNEKVLLSIRGFSPKRGMVDAIGGFLEYGEHPLVGIKREISEETELDISIIDSLGVYLDSYTFQNINKKTLNFFYVGDVLKGNLTAKDDVGKLFWQPINKIPKNIGYKCVGEAFKDLQKWYSNNF